MDSLVKEGKFTQAARKGLILVNDCLIEDCSVRMESDYGTGVRTLPCDFNRSERLAL